MPVARRRTNGFLPTPDLDAHLEAAVEIVYAVWDGGAYIKVGKVCGRHPTQRCADLQTGNPRVLRLVAYTTALTEKQAHRRLSWFRVRGEWFRVAPEVLRELTDWTWVDGEVMAECRRRCCAV